MNNLSKTFILVGFIFVILGIFLIFFEKIPYLGKLPGDIYIKKKNFVFYFPLATSIVISIILTIIINIIFRRK